MSGFHRLGIVCICICMLHRMNIRIRLVLGVFEFEARYWWWFWCSTCWLWEADTNIRLVPNGPRRRLVSLTGPLWKKSLASRSGSEGLIELIEMFLEKGVEVNVADNHWNAGVVDAKPAGVYSMFSQKRLLLHTLHIILKVYWQSGTRLCGIRRSGPEPSLIEKGVSSLHIVTTDHLGSR